MALNRVHLQIGGIAFFIAFAFSACTAVSASTLEPIFGLRLGMTPDEVAKIYPTFHIGIQNSFGYTYAYLASGVLDKQDVHSPTFVEAGFLDKRLCFLIACYGLGSYHLFDDGEHGNEDIGTDSKNLIWADSPGARPRRIWARTLSPETRERLQRYGESSWAGLNNYAAELATAAGLTKVQSSGNILLPCEYIGGNIKIEVWDLQEAQLLRICDNGALQTIMSNIKNYMPSWWVAESVYPRPLSPNNLGLDPYVPFEGLDEWSVVFAKNITPQDAARILSSYGVAFSWIEQDAQGTKAWLYVPYIYRSAWRSVMDGLAEVASAFTDKERPSSSSSDIPSSIMDDIESLLRGPITSSVDTQIDIATKRLPSPSRDLSSRAGSDMLKQRIKTFFKKRYKDHVVVKSEQDHFICADVSGIKGVVVPQRRWWEMLYFRIFLLPDPNGCTAVFVLDGQYAGGLNQPVRKAFRSLEPDFRNELDAYLNGITAALADELQDKYRVR